MESIFSRCSRVILSSFVGMLDVRRYVGFPEEKRKDLDYQLATRHDTLSTVDQLGLHRSCAWRMGT